MADINDLKQRVADMHDEEWRPVIGYEGLYSVSNMGRVKSLPRVIVRSNGIPHTVVQKLLKQATDNLGYLAVSLHRGDEQNRFRVHTLVTEAFLGERQDNVVNHIDKNKKNNMLSNLEYVTPQRNAEYERASMYAFWNPHKRFIHVYNLDKFSRDNSLDRRNLKRVFNGEQRQYKGYTRCEFPISVVGV